LCFTFVEQQHMHMYAGIYAHPEFRIFSWP
jgi:hypothetical protein